MAKLQRNLDLLDIEGLLKLWQAPSLSSVTAAAMKDTSGATYSNESAQPPDGHDRTAPIATGSPDPTMDEWVAFVEEYLASHGGRDYIDENGFLLSVNDPEQEKARLRYLLISYLMSGTFKDCSVILRLGSGYGDTITAIDLDPKSTDRIKKWAAQDRDIVMGYKSKHENEASLDKCHDEMA
jgi:inositol-pentakisphosphate 2-kinase